MTRSLGRWFAFATCAHAVVFGMSNAALMEGLTVDTSAIAIELRSRGFECDPENMRVRFTHDVDRELQNYEEGGSAGVDSDGVGNPGMIYARVFDDDERGRFRGLAGQNDDMRSVFTLGATDALVVEFTVPPASLAKYWSFATYVYRRQSRVVSAYAGWPTNSANARKTAQDGQVVIVATRDRATFDSVASAYESAGFPRDAVNLQPLSKEVRYGRSEFFGAVANDLLTTSLRVAYWPGSPDDDALADWSKLQHRAFIARSSGRGDEPPLVQVDDSWPPSTIPSNELPLRQVSPSMSSMTSTLASTIQVRGARMVGETSMSLMRVDAARCLAEPRYSPWSVHGVQVRSGCFGATPDCLYSISREFFRRDALREFVVIVSGSTSSATFTNFALYATGGAISTALSARDIRVIAAIDDRSFGSSSQTSTFVAAFASSRNGCERVGDVPCVVANEPHRTSTIFVVGRDYLNPSTATAPVTRPDVSVQIFAY